MARPFDTHFNPFFASDAGIAKVCEQRSMVPRVRTNPSVVGISEEALVARYVR